MTDQPTTGRVAVVDGLRTPFAKRGTAYAELSALDLAGQVCAELVDRMSLDPEEIDQVVYGQVIDRVDVHNIAREVVLRTKLPVGAEAYTVSKACITSYQTTVSAAQAIRDGAASCVLAGGADSASDVPLVVAPGLERSIKEAAGRRSLAGRLAALRGVRPGDLVPRAPDLTEPSTDETMGEAAERMAKLNHVDRHAQDRFAHRSHVLASRAWEEGRFDDEVMAVHVPPRYEVTLERDNLVRHDSDLRKYADLPPVFDRAHGTVTAGNSSPLSDGAAALVVMAEAKARALGYEPLGYLRSHAFVAVDPADQLLIGPVHATPIALERAGVKLADLDLIDMHEAFSAQMLSVLQACESPSYGRERLGLDGALGEIDWNILNVSGGSIAVGHPFAATGARQISQTLRELRRRDGELALCTACAAGGLGAAIVLEAA